MADIIKHSANLFSENFETLVSLIKSIGEALQQDARLVINRNITTNAWLTGYVYTRKNRLDKLPLGHLSGFSSSGNCIP